MEITTKMIEAEVIIDDGHELEKVELLDTLYELADVDGIFVKYIIPDPKVSAYLFHKKVVVKTSEHGVRLADERLRTALIHQIETTERRAHEAG